MGLFTSILTRVRKYGGPKILSTGEDFADGYQRQTSPPAIAQTRWHLSDLEGAIFAADKGNMLIPGRLCRSLRRDGVISGVLSTRTDGLVQLPVSFAGDDKVCEGLGKDFRNVFSTAELALLQGDGDLLGVGVAEFVQLPGLLPTLKRLDPTYLQYRATEDRWYYQSIHGVEPVNPGDGRWVLHCPGGAVNPWTHGLWPALGRSYIAKEHAVYFRENYSSKLANAARAAISPQGATQELRKGFFTKVAAWGVNTVFDLPPGWDVKILESKGEGYQVFQNTIDTCDRDNTITLTGQTVTTDGGAGFQNSDIHRTIRSDIIQSRADGLASTITTQGLPVYVNEKFGAAAVEREYRCAWDTTPPKDLAAQATATTQAASAAKAMNELLAPIGKQVDIEAVARDYKVPVRDLANAMTQLRVIPGGKAAAA